MHSVTFDRDVFDAVAFQAGLGGMQAVSYRTVAQLVGRAPSTVQRHFPTREDLLRQSAAHLSRARHRALRSRLAEAGLEGLVPETLEDLFQTGAWLAFRAHARIEPAVAVEVERGRRAERRLIARTLGGHARTTLLHLVVEGLEQQLCDAADPISTVQAQRILYAAHRELVGDPDLDRGAA